MKHYVLGFMFNNAISNVLLIQKRRPEWQAGYLNGIGGHVEVGETPLETMVREFKEEAGVDTISAIWNHALTLYFPYAVVDIFAARCTEYYQNAYTASDEIVRGVYIQDISNLRVISNLPSILILCAQRIADIPGVMSLAAQQKILQQAQNK